MAGINAPGFLPRLVCACATVFSWLMVHGQPPETHEVHGHVLRIESQIPLPEVLVIAWPCRQITTTDNSGAFRVQCKQSIDSLTCIASEFETATVPIDGGDHIDVWLSPLEVTLLEVDIETYHSFESESHRLVGRDLMKALDQTPGIQSLDIGAAMVQPVIRGLYGSRVTVLEDGVPQQGGRWGADHGILADPVLYGSLEWIPGGGHLWMGPESVGGGLRLKMPDRNEEDGESTRSGISYRMGDHRSKVHALHTVTKGSRHWFAGGSASLFSNQNVPQTSFTYLGRSYALTEDALPNTAGRSGHATAGFEQPTKNGGTVQGCIRASDVIQGLFPGIVGIPEEEDLQPQSQRFKVALPMQQASRIQATGIWKITKRNKVVSRDIKASFSWNRRAELAPSHAHGWGPEPTSNLSLLLEELTGFVETVWRGAHGTLGMQVEGLAASTAGWEFLLPGHGRLRWSVMGEKRIDQHKFGVRTDLVGTFQDGYEEPLYNAVGDIVGTDSRAKAMQRLIPGAMASWNYTMQPNSAAWQGIASAVLYTRAPSNYELGANGIHHGTFRFEQGNPKLSAEKSVEGRFQANSLPNASPWSWRVQLFLAMHKDFIALGPSGGFAAISHAGLVYTFTAVDAVRTGLESSISRVAGAWSASAEASILGQWDIATGLGLPFTAPPQLRLNLEHEFTNNHLLSMGCHGMGNARITARNEASTEGAFLCEMGWKTHRKGGTWSLDIHNVFNVAWLDHTSAYRALGLVAQGRWIEISFNTTMKHNKKSNN